MSDPREPQYSNVSVSFRIGEAYIQVLWLGVKVTAPGLNGAFWMWSDLIDILRQDWEAYLEDRPSSKNKWKGKDNA